MDQTVVYCGAAIYIQLSGRKFRYVQKQGVH